MNCQGYEIEERWTENSVLFERNFSKKKTLCPKKFPQKFTSFWILEEQKREQWRDSISWVLKKGFLFHFSCFKISTIWMDFFLHGIKLVERVLNEVFQSFKIFVFIETDNVFFFVYFKSCALFSFEPDMFAKKERRKKNKQRPKMKNYSR